MRQSVLNGESEWDGSVDEASVAMTWGWLDSVDKFVAIILGVLTVGGICGVWIQKRWRRWRARKQDRRLRNWHGTIDVGMINTWFVRLAERPTKPTARVVLEVVDAQGKPYVDWAQNMRQTVTNDGRLSRSPTAEELEILKQLRRERFYGQESNYDAEPPTS